MDIPCSLCGRPFSKTNLTKHHCLPKQKGGTKEDVELLCSQCHGMVHATFTNATLGGPFLKWVRKQPPSRRKRNKPRRRKV
jgi:hypothetical protein